MCDFLLANGLLFKLVYARKMKALKKKKKESKEKKCKRDTDKHVYSGHIVNRLDSTNCKFQHNASLLLLLISHSL